MLRTDITTLKVVMLLTVSSADRIRVVATSSLLTPNHGHFRGLPVRIVIQDRVRRAVETFIEAILPQFRPVCVGIRDTHERQTRYSQRELEDQERCEQLGHTPLSRKPDSDHGCAFACISSSLTSSSFESQTSLLDQCWR